MPKKRKTRVYDASGRQRRALETQEQVLDVARQLFAERGYTETTIEAIATGAGVALPTVYAAFGSKRGVLSKLLARLVSDVPGGSSVMQTAQAQEVLMIPDRAQALRLFARQMRSIQERVIPILEVMKNAARTEADVAELYAKSYAGRYANLEILARSLAERGPLRDNQTIENAARTIWTLVSPDVRQILTIHAGWSGERYETWLADLLIAAILPSGVSGDNS